MDTHEIRGWTPENTTFRDPFWTPFFDPFQGLEGSGHLVTWDDTGRNPLMD